jgi:hypothetical protein
MTERAVDAELKFTGFGGFGIAGERVALLR